MAGYGDDQMVVQRTNAKRNGGIQKGVESRTGFEPATVRSVAARSTIELTRPFYLPA
jgi:hypothetical protein